MTALATVLHLETGHVLSAVASGKVEPTVEQLTAGEHLVVRYLGPAARVEVPAALLSAARVAVIGDVLDRPFRYVLPDPTSPLSLGLDLLSSVGTQTGVPGAKCVVVWQTPDGPDTSATLLDAAGNPPPATAKPAGATHRLVAWENGPLVLETV
jgi:hypothetical protein